MPLLRSHSAVIHRPQLRSLTRNVDKPSIKSVSKPSESNEQISTKHVSNVASRPKIRTCRTLSSSDSKATRAVPVGDKKSSVGSAAKVPRSEVPTMQTQPKQRKTRKKQSELSDPYSFEALLDDDKENIDPEKRIVQSQQKTKKVMPCSKPQVTFRTPSRLSARPSVRPSLSADVERRQSASATIRLPLPPSEKNKDDKATETPRSTDQVTRLASTPTVQALSSFVPCFLNNYTPIHSDLDGAKTGAPVRLDTGVVSSLVPAVHVHGVEPFVVDNPEVSDNSTAHSSHSQSTRQVRSQSLSDHDEAYTSWLEEFNANIEQFVSHELTVEEDKSH